MSERIDFFAHLLPREYIERINDANPAGPLTRRGDQSRWWDVDARLANMDEFGVDEQVVMIAPLSYQELSAEEALPVARYGNRLLRDIADEHPDRFTAVATLPHVTEEFVAHAEEAVEDWGMAGVQILSNVDGEPIDRGSAYEELYELAESRDFPIWIHPNTHDWYEWTTEYMLFKMFGWPFDTTLALARLVFGGVMDRHPDLTVIAHHNGGMIPYYIERIKAYWEKEDDVGWADLSRPIESYFRQFYVDTMLNGSVASLQRGLELWGADHMLLGTDYPFGPDDGRTYMRETIETVEALDASQDDLDRILAGNARELLGR